MNVLAFITIALSILHCEGSHARHGDHTSPPAGVWGSWGPWTRDRECHDDKCDGVSTETAEDTPCTPSDRKDISS